MEAIKDRPLMALSIALILGGTGGYHSNYLIDECDCEKSVIQAVKDERQDCRLDQLEKE